MKKTVKIILYIAFAVYCLALVQFIFLDGRFGPRGSVKDYFAASNLIPFKTVADYIQRLRDNTINTDIVVRNLVGNFVVLFPMGCFLPCLFKPCRRFRNTFFICLGLVLVIELSEPLLCIGSFDVDDFIFNLAGASLGYLAVHIPFVNKVLRRLYVYEG